MKRIDLLPREIEERRKQRRQVVGLIAIGVVWVVLLAAVWFVRQGTLNSEKDRLADAEAQIATLETQIAALEEFRLLDEAVKAKEASLATAMADDIAWSRLLIELSMVIPGDSWITSFSGSASAPADPTPGTAAPGPKYGTVSFSAVTFEFPGVAAWLTRFRGLPSLQSVWVPSATRGAIGEREVVNFSSTADLSAEARSGRFETGGPQ